jgi:enoyl-CoA hydratase
MSYTYLIFEKQGPVARITLNRPEKCNALSIQLSAELADAVNNVKMDDNLKIVVFQGAGGNFSGGDDIGEFPKWGTTANIFERGKLYQHTADEIESLNKITIAAVEGSAVGGGLEITMVCDFVIAAETARFGIPEIDIGMTPGWGGTQRMGRLVGRRRIREMILLGTMLDAHQAKDVELVNKIVPADKLQEAVGDLIDLLLTKPHDILTWGKFIIQKGLEADLHTALGFEVVAGALNTTTKDMKESTSSFVQKTPLWRERRRKVEEYYRKYPW